MVEEVASDAEVPIQEDDWGLSMNFHLFAQHEPHPVYIGKSQSFSVLCVESLTPVDMVDLGAGVHDATGHCVWTGAFLLVACLDKLSAFFSQKRVIELGCGTGIGGIAMMVEDNLRNQKSDNPNSMFLTFTDVNPEVLSLCRQNCELNNLNSDHYAIEKYVWGDIFKSSDFDTALATDVLYDIGLLAPLLSSASSCLMEGGRFILAHVPRACYNSENPPVDNLESHIVEKALEFSFYEVIVLRPSDCEPGVDFPSGALNDISLFEMAEIGAAIFVFQKKTTSKDG